MQLLDLFDHSLVGRADQEGLEFSGRAYTFGELDQLSHQLALALARRGVTAGDRVCIYLPNSPDVVALLVACLKLGAIYVPVNILYRERELEHIRRDAEPKVFVDEAELARLKDAAALHSPDRFRVPLDGDAPAMIVYTSGTTGASKGAVLTHNNLLANTANIVACWEITGADRFLLALPLFHVHGLGNGILSWLATGCRMRLLERFEHQRAAEEFTSFRPTLFFGVPTIYVRLLDAPPEIAAKMRLFVSGSAPLPAHVMEAFRDRFGHTILERYGMSETLMNTSNPYAGERRPGTVGSPLPGISLRLVNGEVQLRGPNVFAGYWRNPEATAKAFDDGWFRTGDMGEVSADGYLTLTGRKSDLIISGGFNIYPREIEELLLEQESVAEAAVVGVNDPVRGEVPVAYIVPRGECPAAVLEAVCREKLASFKVPRAFVAVEALPRTALGKVQKHLLPKP
jgi:malonyl-CoA/methylmalonyl-CoA synthetase